MTLQKESVEGDRLLNAGIKYYQEGNWQQAAKIWEQARIIYVRELGDDHTDTLTSMSNLAIAYKDLGMYDRALALNEQTLKLRRNKLGEEHPHTLASMNNLAIVYGDLGLHGKALALYEQTLELMRGKLGEDHPDTLKTMGNLAVAYSALGLHDKQLALNEQTLKLRRDKLGEDHPDTLVSMNNLAATYSKLGQHDNALPLFTQTLKLRRDKFGEDHPDTLASMNNLALTYRALGQYDKALVLDEQTLKLRRDKLGKDHPDTLTSMCNLALSYKALGMYDKALVLEEQTLMLRRANLGEGHPDTLTSLSNQVATYSALGLYDKALALAEQSLKLRRAKLGEDHPDTLTSKSDLAATYNALGLYDKALALAEQTLKLRRAKLGEYHPDTLVSINNLANTYGALGLYDKALTLAEQSLKLRRAKLGEDHPDTLTSMNNLAVAYKYLGMHDRALALNEQALKLWRTKLGEEHTSTLASMNNLAIVYGDLGLHDKALALHEQTLKLRRTKLGEEHPDTLASMNNLALTCRTLGLYDKALILEEQTLKLSRAKLGEDHPATLTSMNNFASTCHDLGQHEKALSLVPSILAGAEKLRTQAGLVLEQRQSIFAQYADHYQRYARWYARAARIAEGFDIGDLSKARTLTESIKAQAALRSLPGDEQVRLQASQNKGHVLRLRLDKFQNARGDINALLALQNEIEGHNADYAQLLAALQARYPKFAQLTTIAPARSQDAKRLLGADDAFVSYLVDTKGAGQAFVLTPGGEVQWVDLGVLDHLAQTVTAYRELISPSTANSRRGRLVALFGGGYEWLLPGQAMPKNGSPVASNVTDALTLLSTYWHDKLIKPVLPLAGNAKRWIISPDKDLALLPFDTLTEVQGSSTQPAVTLGRSRSLTLVQSFAVYALLKQREAEYAKLPRAKELFAMGNAVYGEGWADNRGIQRASGVRGFESRLRNAIRVEADTPQAVTVQPLNLAAEQYAMRQLLWRNLPGTAQEINSISAVFAGNGKAMSNVVDSYSGRDASEDKLQKLNGTGKLQDYRYLLFSAHGYLAQNPSLSALVLSQQGNPEGVDGYVSASEWPLYDLKSDLTVLSACDTGVGKTQAGESVMGLPYALFVAGNKNTLLSLWPVDDNATAAFMSSFFSKLKAGAKQSDALSQTKQEFMQHPTWSAPKYWAAFVLYGV